MKQYLILHEDEDIMVVDKLAPIPVQPEKTGDKSLQDLLKEELAARLAATVVGGEAGATPTTAPEAAPEEGSTAAAAAAPSGGAAAPATSAAEAEAEEGVFLEAVHRIDRRASGAIIFAKTHRALETLNADFRKAFVDKIYIACVEKEPPAKEGRFEHRLVWDKHRNVVKAFPVATPSGKAAPAADQAAPGTAGPAKNAESSAAKVPAAPAASAKPDKAGARGNQPDKGERGILEYRLAGASERYFFLEIKLITGKHHQIRAQLAAEGMPIRGDIKYGARRTNRNGLLMLHARRLVITQPRTRKTIEVIAPFPEDEPLWAVYGV